MRLRILATNDEALGLLVEHRRSLLKALLLPTLALTLLDARTLASGDDLLLANFLWAPVEFGLYSVFAVSCHRVLLLGETSLPNAWGLYFTAREARFLGWFVTTTLAAIAVIATIAITILALAALGSAFGLPIDLTDDTPRTVEHAFGFAFVLGIVPTWYVGARIGLALPAAAIGRRPTLRATWALSDEDAWRLMIATVIPVAALALANTGITWILGDEPWSPGGLLSTFTILLLGAYEVAVLSVAFRTLGGLETSAPAGT